MRRMKRAASDTTGSLRLQVIAGLDYLFWQRAKERRQSITTTPPQTSTHKLGRPLTYSENAGHGGWPPYYQTPGPKIGGDSMRDFHPSQIPPPPPPQPANPIHYSKSVELTCLTTLCLLNTLKRKNLTT